MMARGRVCAGVAVVLGAASLAVCTWSLETLGAPLEALDGGSFFRALLFGAPGSLLLAVAGIVLALVGLVRANGGSLVGFLALAVDVVAVGLAALVLLVAFGRLLLFV
jgi:hypothetical protein